MNTDIKIQIESGVQALIFDLDGTLANTMPTHYIAWKETVQRYGVDFPEEQFYSWAGISTQRIIKMLNEQHGTAMDPVKVEEEKENAYLELAGNADPIEPVVNLAKEYYGKLPMSCGTGNNREVAIKTLEDLGILHFFETIVTADDVENPKPAPDTFLQCAEYMKIDPEHCQVFEDGDPGIEAAKAGNMFVTDVRDFLK